jgi:hypothetical protein
MDLNNNGKDDIQEVKDGFAQLFNDAKAGNVSGVLQDLKNGAAWTVEYVEDLCDEAQQFLSAVIAKVKSESQTLGEAVANALTLLYSGDLHGALALGQQAIDELKAITSEALTKILSLSTGLKADAAA